MAGFVLLCGDEAKRWLEVQQRLLGPEPKYHAWDSPVSPFCNPAWKLAAVASDVYRSEADGPTEMGWPCRDGLADIKSYHDPLFWHLSNLGRDELILSMNWKPWTEAASPNGPALYCRCCLDAAAISDACDAMDAELSKIGPITAFSKVMAFDAHEDWAICDTEEEAHLLGGTPEFINGYFKAAGGEDYVRAWFYHWDMIGPITLDWDPQPPSKLQTTFYKLIGWPPAPYPKGGKFIGDDVDWTPAFGDRIKSTGPRTYE